MHETNTIEIDGLLPEDCGDDSLSLLDKSLTQQYKLSVQRASNESSNIILDNVWRKNSEALRADATGENLILKTALSLLPNSDISHVLKWKSCYHAESDFTSMISTSLKSCEACNNKNPKHIGFEKFINHKCSCNLNVPGPGNAPLIKTGTKNSMVQMLSPEGSSEEIKLIDEQRHSKTTFRHQRPVKIMHPVQKNIARSDETDSEEDIKAHKANVARITFKTAKEQLLATNPAAKRSLGATRKAQGKFISPMLGAQEKQVSGEPEFSDERLKHIDPKMVELIESEIIDRGTPIGWDDIAGLQLAKSVIQEAVVWPMLRPDIFTGLRQPPKGILLFGPPGTGKTLIGKCVAAQCNATFFSISASSLTSKWIGDGEKMVRALFAVARCRQPAVIFIDEIDSLLTQRSDSEHEATRRIKTEFLVQFDGAAIGEEDRILIVGATNRPQELDEAARRRLVKRLYIPLPDADARRQIISNLLKNESNILCPKDISDIATLTEGYSGADMKSLCSEAAMGPIRSVPLSQIVCIDKDKVRPVCVQDFTNALERVKPSVSQDDLGQYSKWNKTYGQGF